MLEDAVRRDRNKGDFVVEVCISVLEDTETHVADCVHQVFFVASCQVLP